MNISGAFVHHSPSATHLRAFWVRPLEKHLC